jgi:Tol biopolymer transport system component
MGVCAFSITVSRRRRFTNFSGDKKMKKPYYSFVIVGIFLTLFTISLLSTAQNKSEANPESENQKRLQKTNLTQAPSSDISSAKGEPVIDSYQTKALELSYSLSNLMALTPPNKYSAPKWSPDGDKLLFTTIGFTGLYIIDLNENEIITLNTLPGAGYNAEWSEDGKSVFYRHKTTNADYTSSIEVKSIHILDRETKNQASINPNGIASNLSAADSSAPIVYTNTKTLLIEAQTLDKSKKWIVTNNPGQYYQAILSPDKTKVLVHRDGEMFVYAIDGSGLISSLGKGIATSWSSDSKQILFFIGEDDGHKTTGSDLYLCNSDGSGRWRLTNTPDDFEMFPSWSPDNKKIAFSNDRTGMIFTANLIKN